MPRRTPPPFLNGLCSLAIRGHRPNEGGHRRCCSRFEELAPAIAMPFHEVQSGLVWCFHMFSVSVKFNRFNGYWDFQISMDVLCLVPFFKVSLICKSRNFGRVSVTINVARFCWSRKFRSSSLSLTFAEGTLLGYPWANAKNEREVATHWIVTCQSQHCTCWSIQDNSSMYWRVSVRVSAVLRQRACGSGERGVPDGNLELADGRSLLAAWFGLKDCSGPRVWTDITWYNIVKLLAPVGMENVKGACDSASPDRGRFMQPILDKNETGKSSSQATCQQVSIDQPRIWMYRLDLVPMHGILCVNPADPFQFHGLRRQHQEQVGCLLIVSSYTWPKGFKMSQMGMRRTRWSKRARMLVMCSFMMGLDLSTSPYFQV